MKLLLRPELCSPGLARRLATDSELTRALGAVPNPAVGLLFKKSIDSRSPEMLSLLLHAEALGERVAFLRDLQFTSAELTESSHLEVVCRRTAAQTNAERSRTLEDYRALSLLETASRWPVRIPNVVYLSKQIPTDTIVQVDQYTGEYAMGAGASPLLTDASLSGYRLAPIVHWKTRAARPEIGMHLSSKYLWPAVSASLTQGQMSDLQRSRLLSYEPSAYAGAPDFGRTAEPWGSWQTPQWIVSQRVRTWAGANGVKGWDFWPVLEEGSALHAVHAAVWGHASRLLDGAGARLA